VQTVSNKETVCIPASQARQIAQALQRFEKLKPAYLLKQQAIADWRAVHGQDSAIAAKQVLLINWYKITYAEEQGLRQDSNKKLAISQGKARRRGLLVAIETVGIALAGYVIITK
jgi:hypothetical protein